MRLPVMVRDALAASASFLVRADAVEGWLPAGLRVRRVLPGRALLGLTAVHYRDNDLGRYDELAVAVVVDGGVYIHRLPVNDEFSRAAGREIWGFPKTVEDLSVRRAGGEVVCEWRADGAPVLRLVVDGHGRRRLRTTRQQVYSVLDGQLCATRFFMRARGAGLRPGGARITLGEGPVAAELRGAGLGLRPVFSMSMEHLQARFDGPVPAKA